jgi:hypothetical protein
LQPADAPGVTACVKEVYGDSYARPELYDPEQIVRMNRTGELVSIVAVHGESLIPAAGVMDMEINPGLQMTTIRVRKVGLDAPAKVAQARRDLCGQKGIESIILEMPLTQSGTAAACEELENDGFFFSGIGPDFATDGDALRLQYLTTEIDISLLQIEKPFARELVQYVASERKRTRALA